MDGVYCATIAILEQHGEKYRCGRAHLMKAFYSDLMLDVSMCQKIGQVSERSNFTLQMGF